MTFRRLEIPKRIGPVRHNDSTHISPAAHDVQQVVAAERQVDDALVDRLAAPLGRQVGLRDLHPAEGADGEADGPLLGVARVQRVAHAEAGPRRAAGGVGAGRGARRVAAALERQLLAPVQPLPGQLLQGGARVAARDAGHHGGQRLRTGHRHVMEASSQREAQAWRRQRPADRQPVRAARAAVRRAAYPPARRRHARPPCSARRQARASAAAAA